MKTRKIDAYTVKNKKRNRIDKENKIQFRFGQQISKW